MTLTWPPSFYLIGLIEPEDPHFGHWTAYLRARPLGPFLGGHGPNAQAAIDAAAAALTERLRSTFPPTAPAVKVDLKSLGL